MSSGCTHTLAGIALLTAYTSANDGTCDSGRQWRSVSVRNGIVTKHLRIALVNGKPNCASVRSTKAAAGWKRVENCSTVEALYRRRGAFSMKGRLITRRMNNLRAAPHSSSRWSADGGGMFLLLVANTLPSKPVVAVPMTLIHPFSRVDLSSRGALAHSQVQLTGAGVKRSAQSLSFRRMSAMLGCLQTGILTNDRTRLWKCRGTAETATITRRRRIV